MKLIYLILILILNLNLINSFHTNENEDKKFLIQQTSFFFLTAIGYRGALSGESWCEESKVPGGIPYLWSDQRNMIINYLDLYISLQFDPDCEDNLVKLRQLYIDNVVQPIPFTTNSTFWEDVFLPLVLDSFTCGFNGSKLESFDMVSHDLRKNFNNELFKQKIWFMIGPYMTSIYKQRENANRRLDFDAGLYIPFLDKWTGYQFNYTYQQQLRIGFPSYIGRSLWHIFHTLAQRIADNQCNSKEINDQLYKRVKNFFVSFIRGGHPCPICSYHNSQRILTNDRYAADPIDNEAIRYYPIEHLLLGGLNGDIITKLNTIQSSDIQSLAKFFWILHNAVTSSVDNGCSCFTEENEDTQPYNCVMDYRFQIQSQFPRQQRSYPFMKRFEYILTSNHNYTLFDSARENFKSILMDINKLDTFNLRKELVLYWQRGENITEYSLNQVEKLFPLIEEMKNQFIESGLLKQVYNYNSVPLKCNLILEKLNNSTQDAIEKFEKSPDICKPYIQPSLCDQQYLYRYFTKQPSNPTTTSYITSTTGSGQSTSTNNGEYTTTSTNKNVNTTSETNTTNFSISIFNLINLILILILNLIILL